MSAGIAAAAEAITKSDRFISPWILHATAVSCGNDRGMPTDHPADRPASPMRKPPPLRDESTDSRPSSEPPEDTRLAASSHLVTLTGSFEIDVLSYRSELFRYALSRTDNASDAEDLLQETLLRAFQAYARVRVESNVKAWLFTIMRNTWIDSRRSAARRPREFLSDDLGDVEGGGLAPTWGDHVSAEQQALAGAFDTDVARAMASLSETNRTTVVLVWLLGLDSGSAGRILGVSSGTVLARMHRSRRMLRQLLHDRAPLRSIRRVPGDPHSDDTWLERRRSA